MASQAKLQHVLGMLLNTEYLSSTAVTFGTGTRSTINLIKAPSPITSTREEKLMVLQSEANGNH